MSLYDSAIAPMKQSLANLERWLDQAEEHAASIPYEADVLLSARLYPDQYPLVRQIQAACDAAKLAAARLSGKDAPKHEDTEQTFAEIRARIAATIAFLDTLSPADFEGTEETLIKLPFAPGMASTGADYIRCFSLPNFYFHLVHAYALLRTNGVPLGKRTFLGHLPMREIGEG